MSIFNHAIPFRPKKGQHPFRPVFDRMDIGRFEDMPNLVLSPALINPYIAWFLQQPYQDKLSGYLRENRLVFPEADNIGVFERFRRPTTKDKSPRTFNTCPYTRNEFEKASARIEHDPDILNAAIILQFALLNYFEHIDRFTQKYFAKNPTLKRDIHLQIDFLSGGIATNAIIEELLPSLATPNPPAQPFSQKSISLGFNIALTRRNTFTSVMEDDEKNYIETTCPFKHAMAHLMTMQIIEQPDGSLKLGDHPTHGGVFWFIYQRLKNAEQKAPTPPAPDAKP